MDREESSEPRKELFPSNEVANTSKNDAMDVVQPPNSNKTSDKQPCTPGALHQDTAIDINEAANPVESPQDVAFEAKTTVPRSPLIRKFARLSEEEIEAGCKKGYDSDGYQGPFTDAIIGEGYCPQGQSWLS